MRKSFFIATFITLAVGINQAQILDENFESGLPTSVSANETKVMPQWSTKPQLKAENALYL